MNMYWCICHEVNIRLWNLTSRSRLQRVLKKIGVTNFLENIQDLPPESSLFIVRGDYLFDDRILLWLSKEKNSGLEIRSGSRQILVAAHVDSSHASPTWQSIQNGECSGIPNLQTKNLENLSLSFSNELRKSDHPFVLPIREDNKEVLEGQLFTGSYKGVTDLVTKFLWPIPAKWATRLCALRGISPNQVTTASLVLVVIVGILFAYGYFLEGLVLGWVMTFLDTVDGKLARVTVTSTKWGNLFDHGIDLIHPPLWYLAWGIGLSSFIPVLSGITLEVTFGAILIGYIVGRIIEGIFQWWWSGFVIFCWKPVDSYFRLIAARRNPCLILLTSSVALGRPDWGLEAVAIWTVVSTVILIGRFLMSVWEKTTTGSLTSWLAKIDPGNRQDSLAVRLFTNPPARIK
jgi:phosphatidylglycerophosphate synthase